MMGRIMELTDLNAPELDLFARLTEAQLRNRREPEKGIFIAESPKVIRCALRAGLQPLALLMERRHLTGQGASLMEDCGDIPVYTGDSALLAQLTGFSLSRGILCAMRRPAPLSARQVCNGARRVAVLENIVDSTNIGAIFRSAAALGVDGVLLTPSCGDPLSRRAARVSMGTVFQIPWGRIGQRPEDWPEAGLEQLKAWGFQTAALALTDQSLTIDTPQLRQCERLAILLGTEGDGLTDQTIALCDAAVRIPMQHGVDSLNVAAAGAVAFWELCRQF